MDLIKRNVERFGLSPAGTWGILSDALASVNLNPC